MTNEERLVSMMKFHFETIEKWIISTDFSEREALMLNNSYACFLSKELNVGMFIPCNEEQRVLFKGFEISDFDLNSNSGIYYCKKIGVYVGGESTIEDLVPYNLELTEAAKKEIGL